ncbi:unnamed protein product [Effrenium voratum]|nr:unnamed protein product [Effrenium voratum]
MGHACSVFSSSHSACKLQSSYVWRPLPASGFGCSRDAGPCEREAMKALQALTCLLLAYDVAAAKLKARRSDEIEAEEWCDGNRFPAPSKQFSARGLSKFADVFEDAELAELREALQKDADWQLGATWEFKAKVSSGYNGDLLFGFPGGGGGYLKFSIPAGADAATVRVVDQVKAVANNVELEYRGTSPPSLTAHPVTIFDVCIRPPLCSDYTGCLPAYKYANKKEGTGASVEDCCTPLLCKEQLSDGCSPSTEWQPATDFDERLGNSLEHCCVAQVCSEATCNSSKYKLREGSGLLGSTEEECCDKLFCVDFKDLCDPAHDASRLPDLLKDGSKRLGSAEDDCCNVTDCEHFDCSDPAGRGLWTNKAKPEGRGHTFSQCCDKLFCEKVDCKGHSKYGPEASGEEQGSTPEVCCKPRLCKDYQCSLPSLRVVAGDRLGSSDAECCETQRCEDYQCSSPTKWEKKPSIEETEDGGQVARVGFSDEDCCVPKYCKNFLCSSTKWQTRHWPENDTTLGGSFEECCDELMCADYNCTTDYDGDGVGTMYIKKQDTNNFRFQGSSDEECCEPRPCSDYETKFPTKWRRKTKPNLLGSTDTECFEPLWCADFCGCKAEEKKVPVEDAKHKQGSTVAECCKDM